MASDRFTFEPEGTAVPSPSFCETSSHSSASTEDSDEEILYHLKRLQLFHAKHLAQKFRREGYKSMDQILTLDLAQLTEQFNLGAGDLQNLAQGLEHYRGGTFEAAYALPLEDIVESKVVPLTVDMSVQTEASVGDEGAGAVGPPSAKTASRILVPRFSQFERFWVRLAWSGAPASAIAAMIMRCLAGFKKDDPLRQAFFALLGMAGLTVAMASGPILGVTHAVGGLKSPALSMGLGALGGFVSTVAAGVCCDLTSGGCFDSSAQVMLPNRSQKSIADLHEGDWVMSFNRGLFRVKRVLRCLRGGAFTEMVCVHFSLPLGEPGMLITTPGHPVWVCGKGWRAVPPVVCSERVDADHELALHDCLVHHSGSAAKVVAIKACSRKYTPYNILVDGPGTFFVSGMLVNAHMAKCGLVPGRGGCVARGAPADPCKIAAQAS